jgi:hypothetical protein
MNESAIRRIPSSQDAADYADIVANITELHLQLCTPLELSAMLAKIIGAMLATSLPDWSDERLMEFVLNNVMDAKYGI